MIWLGILTCVAGGIATNIFLPTIMALWIAYLFPLWVVLFVIGASLSCVDGAAAMNKCSPVDYMENMWARTRGAIGLAPGSVEPTLHKQVRSRWMVISETVLAWIGATGMCSGIITAIIHLSRYFF